MSKSSKIKALLAMNDIKSNEYAKKLKLANPQALTTKYARESFTSDDLIKLADLTGTKLAFVDDQENVVIKFDKDDLRK